MGPSLIPVECFFVIERNLPHKGWYAFPLHGSTVATACNCGPLKVSLWSFISLVPTNFAVGHLFAICSKFKFDP